MKTEPLVCMTHRDEVQNSSPLPDGQSDTFAWVFGNPGKGVALSNTRLRAADLRDAQRQSGNIPIEDRRATPLLLEIEVLIDTTAREARRELARLQGAGTTEPLGTRRFSSYPRPMRYIGTVQGLSGLIQDICAVGIADGVVLIPLSPHPTEKLIMTEVAELIA
ncbi:hypothetical protein R1X32_06720 (plasmid) [Rhodococcus opacus]